MALFTFTAIFCIVLVDVRGQTTIPPPPVIDGPCPKFTPVATLDSKAVAGKYFVVSHIRGGFGQYDPLNAEKCVTTELKANPDNTFLYLWSLTTVDNQILSGNATTELINGRNVEQTLVVPTGGEPRPAEEKTTVTFLDVDPTAHAAYVVCETDGNTHRWTFELASKEKTLAPAIMKKINKVLTANKLPTTLHSIAQTC